MKNANQNAAALLMPDSAEALGKHDPMWLERVRELERLTLSGSLTPSVALLVQIAIHVSVTGMNERALQHFISQALDSGISYTEIVAVFKLCTILGIHGAVQASPIIEECLERHGQTLDEHNGETPIIDSMKQAGKFNPAWESLDRWDPLWLDSLLSVGLAREIVDVLGARTFELLCIAIDATVTHIYHPGIRRHIDAALSIGIPPQEVLDVIKLVSIQGIRSMDVGVRILEEHFNRLNTTNQVAHSPTVTW